nr:MAG TPA: Major capsid protein [Caudoviricetes sp.]
MAYENFIPSVWNEGIQRNLERQCVFVEDCNREYEGDVKQKGDSVRILGVGRPTIKSIARENTSNDIDGPEEVEDTSVVLPIDQIRYFNYMVGDIDKAQAVGGVMDALQAETAEGLADEVDKYIGNHATDKSIKKLYSTVPKVVAGTASSGEKNVLDILDEAVQVLYENDVKTTTKIVATVSPRFYMAFRKAYTAKDTDNSKELKNGKVSMYGNIIIKMSNNVCKTDSGATDNIMMRTQRAIAYANPLTHTEPYRPEKKFADAVKGYILFGSKIVRPKEIVNINVKYA